MFGKRHLTAGVRRLLILLPAAVAALTTHSLEAQITTSWTGTLGYWSDPINWDNGVPTSSSTASISNGGTANMWGLDSCDTLILASSPLSLGTARLGDGGQLSLSGNDYVGYSGSGTFMQYGGSNRGVTSPFGGQLYLGYNATGIGTYYLGGDGELWRSGEVIGYSGRGTFTQSGGINWGGEVCQGWNSGGSGTYNLSGGTLDARRDYIGLSGTGMFTQSGGVNFSSLHLGVASGGSGTYNLGGGAVLAREEHIGDGGTGTFTQSGGTIAGLPWGGSQSLSLYLGYFYGGSGTYNLSGGALSAGDEYVGYSGTGTFTQSGGTNSVGGALYVGYYFYGAPAGNGSYRLSGTGTLVVSPTGEIRVGTENLGRFEWFSDRLTSPSLTLGSRATLAIGFDFDVASLTDGTPFHGTTVSGLSSAALEVTNGAIATHADGGSVMVTSLTVGTSAGSGTYNLSGSGQLAAQAECLGYDAAATGLFRQSGGTNTTSLLFINNNSQYQLSGGTLQLNGPLQTTGTLDFAGGAASINATGGAILDFSQGSPRNSSAATLNIGANGVLIVPPGFDPASAFADYTNAGLTYTAGKTLLVPPGQGFTSWGSINSLVDCQGSITAAANRYINLNGGLMLSGSGIVSLGRGALRTDNGNAGMSGGSLLGSVQYVGCSGTGTFNQSGGTSGFRNLYLGNNLGARGSYNLSGPSLLSVVDYSGGEYIGYSGSGIFCQSGGTNSVSNGLNLGWNSGANGTYNLSGSGHVSASNEYVGFSGSGMFRHSGGANTIANNLYLGGSVGATGMYNLSGSGQVSVSNEYIGNSGSGVFRQSGGANNIDRLYLGNNLGASGTYRLSGRSLVSAAGQDGSEYIGYSGSGIFCQSGGTNSVSNGLNLGWNSGASGTYNLSGRGQLSVGAGEYVGIWGTGAFAQSGGTNSTSTLYVGNGTYNLNGGLLQTAAIWTDPGRAAFNFGGGTLKATGSFTTSVPITINRSGAFIDTNGYDVTVDSNMAGSGGLTKTGGSGTLALMGSNTYRGDTTIEAGTLGGTGSIGGAVVLARGAAIDPGTPDAGGLLTVGTLTAKNGSLFDFDLGSPSGTNDEIRVTASDGLKLLGVSTVNISELLGSSFGSGDYPLIAYDGTLLPGWLNHLALGSVPTGFVCTLSNNLTTDSIDLIVSPAPALAAAAADLAGGNVALEAGRYCGAPTTIPEPGTWTLVVSSILCLLPLMRRRKRDVS